MKKLLAVLYILIALGGTIHCATIITGDISTDTTLYMSNNPHQIRGTVRVLDGATLALEPGVNVLFEANSVLEIQGQISAMGSVEQPILFHSIDGDQHYTRVFLNGAEGSTFYRCAFSRARDYSGLMRIENSGAINLLNCSFGTTINAHGIYIANSSVNINSTSLSSIANNGIHIQGSSTVNLFDVGVDGCQTGIYIPQGQYPILEWENIQVDNSSSYPLYAGIAQYAVLTGLYVSGAATEMLAVWSASYGSGTEYTDLWYRHFNAAGQAQETAPQLLCGAPFDQKVPQVAEPSGQTSFVSWADARAGVTGTSTPAYGVHLQKLAYSGSPNPDGPQVPSALQLRSCYPNPFTSSVHINWYQKDSHLTQCDIYNVRGQLVKRFPASDAKAGEHYQVWNGEDRLGRQSVPGIYIIVVRSGDAISSGKVVKTR